MLRVRPSGAKPLGRSHVSVFPAGLVTSGHQQRRHLHLGTPRRRRDGLQRPRRVCDVSPHGHSGQQKQGEDSVTGTTPPRRLLVAIPVQVMIG
jgi:hypothetical protein